MSGIVIIREKDTRLSVTKLGMEIKKQSGQYDTYTLRLTFGEMRTLSDALRKSPGIGPDADEMLRGFDFYYEKLPGPGEEPETGNSSNSPNPANDASRDALAPLLDEPPGPTGEPAGGSAAGQGARGSGGGGGGFGDLEMDKPPEDDEEPSNVNRLPPGRDEERSRGDEEMRSRPPRGESKLHRVRSQVSRLVESQYRCSGCGHEVSSASVPNPIKWANGHICRFVASERESIKSKFPASLILEEAPIRKLHRPSPLGIGKPSAKRFTFRKKGGLRPPGSSFRRGTQA